MDARPQPRRDEYQGKADFQGNRRTYEMPEEHKPGEPTEFPAKQILIAVIVITLLAGVSVAIYGMLKQSGSFL